MESDFEYVKRHTELSFPNENYKIIRIENNLDNYLTAVFKIDTAFNFFYKNEKKEISCKYLNLSEKLFKKELWNIYQENHLYTVCFGAKDNKKWWASYNKKSGYLFIEIWY